MGEIASLAGASSTTIPAGLLGCFEWGEHTKVPSQAGFGYGSGATHGPAAHVRVSDKYFTVLKGGTKLLERRLREVACLGNSEAVFALVRKLAEPIDRMLRRGRSSLDLGAAGYESHLRCQSLASLGTSASSLG